MKKTIFFSILILSLIFSACEKDELQPDEIRLGTLDLVDCTASIDVYRGDEKVGNVSIFVREILSYRDTTYNVTDTVGWNKWLVYIEIAGSLTIYHYDSTAIVHVYAVTDQIIEYEYNLTIKASSDTAGLNFNLSQQTTGRTAYLEGRSLMSGIIWPLEGDITLAITGEDGTFQEYTLTVDDLLAACG